MKSVGNWTIDIPEDFSIRLVSDQIEIPLEIGLIPEDG